MDSKPEQDLRNFSDLANTQSSPNRDISDIVATKPVPPVRLGAPLTM